MIPVSARSFVRRRTPRPAGAALTLAVAVLTLAGCSGDPEAGVAATADDPAVVMPGRPGEAASTAPGSQVSLPPPPAPNAVDVTYLQMMIPHHQQALEMAELAADRVANPALERIADRIAAAQGPEIDLMESWLEEWEADGVDVGHGDHTAHSEVDHADMPGMATPAELAELAASEGEAFDVRFVQLMSDHHQGAIDMSEDVLAEGSEREVNQLALDVSSSQAVEIGRMQDLLPE